MKKLVILFFTTISCVKTATPQGCIMVRNISGFGQYNFTDNSFSTSKWYLNITGRYFKSNHDFVGTQQLDVSQDRVQTIHSFTTDLSIIRLFADGWSLSLSIPFSANSRTSKLEHGGISNAFHTTHSFGLGDIRITAYKWLVAPKVRQKLNVQLGLGVKLPSGDYQYQDYFYRREDSAVLAPVNPSIQLGDGGTGIIAETNALYVLDRRIGLFGNFYYLSNPRDQNGTSNQLGRPPVTDSMKRIIKAGGDINSVPDQYSIRIGGYYKLNDWVLSMGLRDEGIPVYDLIGDSNGFRKPGHNTSIEPGVIFSKGKTSVYVYVPIVVATRIKQSVPDKKESDLLGKFVHRQGNSTNYFVLAGFQLKF